MALPKLSNRTQILLLVPVLGAILFLGATDLLSLTNADLSLLALSEERRQFIEDKQNKAQNEGQDKGKGHKKNPNFKNKGFPCPPPKGCFKDEVIIDPPTGNIIDPMGNVIVSASDALGGGGALGSTVGIEGFQELVSEDVQIFPAIRSPAKGQSIIVTFAIEWIGDNPLIVTHAQFGMFDDLFSYPIAKQIPQRVFAEDASTVEKKGEFLIEFTLPEDSEQTDFIIPVRLIVDTGAFQHTLVTHFEIESSLGIIQTFSFAELIRTFLALLRVG